MLTPLAHFPVRPRMEEGESLAGYISRFRAANGYGMSGALCDALRVLYRGSPGRASTAFGLVQSMLGESVILDRSWWLGRPLIERHGGNSPPAWPTLQFLQPGFCPACLLDSGFHFALWELPLMEACPLHQCALVCACPVCTRKLLWQNLSPIWRCRCGASIATMPLATPKSAALGLARALASSSHVIPPGHFDGHLIAPGDCQHHLEDFYKGLEWGTAFRELFFKRGSLMGNLTTHQRQRVKRRVRWGFWERRLLGDSPEELISRLLRVQQKRFKGKQLLRFVFPNDGLVQAQEFARKAAPGVVQTKIQETLGCFLAGYAIDLRLSLFVWFSEEKNSERRNAYMREFATWWSVLASRMGDPDPAMQWAYLATPQQAGAPHTLQRENEVVDILNLLFDAARQRIDVANFREVIYWWRIPPVLRDIGDPDELFRRIGLHLASTSDGEISFVLDLIQGALKGK